MKMLLLDDNQELIRRIKAFITTGEGEGEGEGEGSGGGDGADDLSTLFSAEEIASKRTSVADAATEETRRAALSDEDRATEDTAAAEALALGEVPEKYEFTIPEGVTIDEALMTDVSTFAADNKLSIGEAQKIADMGVQLMTKQQELRETQFNEIKAGWLETAKTDTEIGADVSKGEESLAARAFNTIATPEMKELVDHYGIGNHPEMLRMFFRLSSLMGDDGMQLPGTGAGLGKGDALAETVGGIFDHPSRKAG